MRYLLGIDNGGIFSGAGKGLYMIGHDGKPSYNKIMSTDTRAWKQVEEWYADGIAVGIYKDYADAISKTVKITKTVYPRSEYKEIYEKKICDLSCCDRWIRCCLGEFSKLMKGRK